MLYTAEEIEVMASAIQENLRASQVRVKPYETIMSEQLPPRPFEGRCILDIGPGQWDLLDLARQGGACATTGVDFDPAVIRLGQIRGHEAIHANLSRGWPLSGRVFNGIFCRGSFNQFWFAEPARALDFLDAMLASLAPDGWFWMAPFNNPSKSRSPEATTAIEEAVAHWRVRHGVEAVDPDERQKKVYGVGYTVPRVQIWRKGCAAPPAGLVPRLKSFLFRKAS